MSVWTLSMKTSLCVLALTVSGCGARMHHLNAAASGASPIVAIVAGASYSSTPFPDREFMIVFRNPTDRVLRCDRRIMAPLLMVSIVAEDGSNVPKIPPSTPRTMGPEDIVAILPGHALTLMFQLKNITFDPLQNAHYALVARYIVPPDSEAASLGAWSGTLISEPLVILRNKTTIRECERRRS